MITHNWANSSVRLRQYVQRFSKSHSPAPTIPVVCATEAAVALGGPTEDEFEYAGRAAKSESESSSEALTLLRAQSIFVFFAVFCIPKAEFLSSLVLMLC